VNEEGRRRIREFLDQRGLPEHHAHGLEVYFSGELADPPSDILRYVRTVGLDEDLVEPLVELYRSVRSVEAIGGRYRLQRSIGHGGMGQIWEAFDERFGTRVAMKILQPRSSDPEAERSRFRLEMRILAELQHPNVLPVHDCGELTDGRLWFTMPRVEGHDFRREVEVAHTSIEPGTPRWEPGSPGWSAIQSLLRGFLGVCDAVAVAHRRGIVHRDLSDRNIYVGPHGQYYVLDWGIARWDGVGPLDASDWGGPASASAHRTIGWLGNPVYMSTEQALGNHDVVGERSDVYSLGALLYLLLSNRAPYDGPTPQDIVNQVQVGPPTREPGLQWSPSTLRTLSSPLVSGGARSAEPPERLVAICKKAMSR